MFGGLLCEAQLGAVFGARYRKSAFDRYLVRLACVIVYVKAAAQRFSVVKAAVVLAAYYRYRTVRLAHERHYRILAAERVFRRQHTVVYRQRILRYLRQPRIAGVYILVRHTAGKVVGKVEGRDARYALSARILLKQPLFCCKADSARLEIVIPGNAEESDMVEVQFKNTRKGYFRNSNKIKLEKGDVVAVEAAPGHDIGVVTLTGRLVPLQMKKANFKADAEIKRVYRKAKPVDMEKFNEAKAKEHATMIRARQIALNLNLDMKIGDVEYQGDGNKAIFYYIADERVDFRQLIKVLAEAFRVRIEMKQIGARQEAGRIGGIGPCGRELCCATWMTSFVSVSTSAARFQDISLNPQKLAGQCAKLKCCLNYEVDCYVEAQKRLPSREIELETKDGTFYFFKADILSNQVSYSTDKNFPANLVTISGKRAFEVISMNKKGMKPDSLLEEEKKPEPRKPVDLLEQESVTRFDRSRNNKEGGNNANRNNKKKKKGNNNNGNRPQQQAEGGNRPQQPQRENENRPQQSENGNRGERDNRPRNNNNNNRNRGQNQGRNNENRRPERGSNQERPQGQERSNQERPQQQDRQREQQGQERQERRPNHERPSRPERNQNQEKQSTNEKPTQE